MSDNAVTRISKLGRLVNKLPFKLRVALSSFKATRALLPAADRDHYDLIFRSGLFDAAWYVDRYPDIKKSKIDPFRHFNRHGWRELRSPGPSFDTEWYVQRYPDVGERNALLHYLLIGRSEGRQTRPPAPNLEVARKLIFDTETLDPELMMGDYGGRVEELTAVFSAPQNRITLSFDNLLSQITSIPKSLIFVPWLKRGGADLLACHAARAQSQMHGPKSVLVVITDSDEDVASDCLPADIALVKLAPASWGLSLDERSELVEALIRALQPAAVLNINSHACWKATKEWGKRLNNFTKLYAMLFCQDYNDRGRASGYSKIYFRDCLPSLKAVYFDNESHRLEVIEEFGIPLSLQNRLVTLRQPSPNMIVPGLTAGSNAQNQVLWASRISRQKNVALLRDIIKGGQAFHFHVWGAPDEPEAVAQLEACASEFSNVTLHGRFERFSDLPLKDYFAFLYTSLWDGLPNVLLEASAAGLPVVAPRVGGISELVDDYTGWLVPSLDASSVYIDALAAIASNRAEALRRAVAMQERLKQLHSWELYTTILFSQPLGLGGFLDV